MATETNTILRKKSERLLCGPWRRWQLQKKKDMSSADNSVPSSIFGISVSFVCISSAAGRGLAAVQAAHPTATVTVRAAW